MYAEIRRQVLETTLKCYRYGLIRLTSGNVSVRASEEHIVITPSSVPYDGMTPEDMTVVDLLGRPVEGHYRPSSETPMHVMIYREMCDVNAIVHTHSVFALVFATVGKPIPVLSLEGLEIHGDIPVAEYATPGTIATGGAAVKAMMGPPRVNSVLLRNHGGVSVGSTLDKAYQNAVNMETMAEVYYRGLQIGTPVPLTRQQLDDIYRLYKK